MDSKELCRLIILMILIKDPLAMTQDRSVKVLVVMVGSVNIVGQLLSIWPRLVQYDALSFCRSKFFEPVYKALDMGPRAKFSFKRRTFLIRSKMI